MIFSDCFPDIATFFTINLYLFTCFDSQNEHVYRRCRIIIPKGSSFYIVAGWLKTNGLRTAIKTLEFFFKRRPCILLLKYKRLLKMESYFNA